MERHGKPRAAERVRAIVLGATVVAGVISVDGQGPGNFKPTAALPAASLSGWHQLGDATWKAERGEIVGTPGANGGWLVLDKGLQDVQYFSNFKCSPGCQTGVLLRASKTPDGGLTGAFVSLTEGDLASYRVTLDARARKPRARSWALPVAAARANAAPRRRRREAPRRVVAAVERAARADVAVRVRSGQPTGTRSRSRSPRIRGATARIAWSLPR